MKDISLHIMDIAQNSVRAGADNVRIDVHNDNAAGKLTLKLSDNGKGMSELMVRNVIDPFFTTRKTRNIGLGLPLLKQNAELSGGYFRIVSGEGRGTSTLAVFNRNNIDCLPLGDISGVFTMLVAANPGKNFILYLSNGVKTFQISTKELRKEGFDSATLSDPGMISAIKEYINESLNDLTNKNYDDISCVK